MRTATVAKTLLAGWITLSAATAWAQLYPWGYSNYGWGGWGGDSTMQNIAAEQTRQDQNLAAQQSAMMQQGIRNTLTSQATAQNQAILSRNQSNRDWWFQMQQQQTAQRQSRAAWQPPPPTFAPVARGAAFEPAVGFSSVQASDDVIQWPAALTGPQFAALRSRIEAPYRRTPGKISYPTATDYQSMLQPIQQMKTLLGDMASEITAREYLDAEAFLNLIASQARERSEKPAAGKAAATSGAK